MAPLSLWLALAGLCAAADRKSTPVELPVLPVAASLVPAQALVPIPALEAGRAAAAVRFDALAGARVQFTPEQKAAVLRLETSVVAAARQATRAVEGLKGSAVVSRGSTSRGTQAGETADFDINVRLPKEWTQPRFDEFVAKDALSFAEALARALKADLGADVETGSPTALSDTGTRRPFPGTVMIPVRAYDASRALVLDADVTLTIDDAVSNDYPAYFAAQLERARASGGEEGAERLLGDIRLAKRYFKESLGAYTPWRGGPGGVGVEQMVIQAGGFEPMMRTLAAISFDEQGAPRPKAQATARWKVENPFMRPANFLDLISVRAWERLGRASKDYVAAQDAGRPLRLEDLGAKKKAAPAPAVKAERPAADLTVPAILTARVESKLNLVRFNEYVRGLRPKSVRKAPGSTRAYLVSFELPRGADPAQTIAALERLGPVSQLSSPRAEPFAKFDAVLAVESARAEDPKRAGKALKRLPKLLERQPGVKSVELVDGARLGVVLEDPARARAVVETLAAALEDRKRFKVAAASYRGTPGAATLAMLDRFTIDGPKPADRGEAFLYAQGAKTLPAELEAAAEKARAAVEPALRLRSARTTLLRRNGRVFVAVSDPDDDFGTAARIQVPEDMVLGIPGDALIDVELEGRRVVAARPVLAGARADVVIGRARAGRLEPLFEEGLYPSLPLSGGGEGRIVQAFVKAAAGGGFEASVLLDLGAELTPEIAAREIALRHGARGYFPAEVVAQTEKAAAAQGEGSLALPAGFEDLRALPFVTIDPVGAGDLDDAFHVEKHADGGYTWILATADVARYVAPGTPAFRQAARLGNTFYSIDKQGVSDYPMNHPVVAKSLSSLLADKDSYAMVTRMRFDARGTLLPEQSSVGLGLVRARGRYTYDEVAAEWGGGKAVAHGPMIALARELAAKLRASDDARGELTLDFDETAREKTAGGWRAVPVRKDPLIEESHRLIAELKVYGNRVIAGVLTGIAKDDGVPHISRIHPKQDQKRDEMARRDLAALGVPWPKNQTLPQYLAALMKRTDVSREAKQLAQIAALRSRSSARYAVVDLEGHDGLALKSGEYDHPSAPIRRFSDMYNRALLETRLEGGDVRALYETILADLRALGFDGLEDFVDHLNGREQASRQMDYEVERFMNLWELAQARNQGRPLKGYVRSVRLDRRGGAATVEVQLEDPPVSVTLTDRAYARLKPLDAVAVTVRSAEPAAGRIQAKITSR